MTIEANVLTVNEPEDKKYFLYANIVRTLFKVVYITLLLILGICTGIAMIGGMNMYIGFVYGICAFILILTSALNAKLDIDFREEIRRIKNEQDKEFDDIILCNYENCTNDV